MTIGRRIGKVRTHLGLTQAELGTRIGYSGSHISKLERGEAQPSEELILSLCAATSARPQWLKNGDGPMFDTEVPAVDYASAGERVRKARKKKGLTQQELANSIGSSANMVNKAELGKVQPSDRWLSKVAQRCQVSLQWLRTGQEESGDRRRTEENIKQIEAFLREHDQARAAVTEAIQAGDSGIWTWLEQLAREKQG